MIAKSLSGQLNRNPIKNNLKKTDSSLFKSFEKKVLIIKAHSLQK